ncbi:flagellar basal body protein, partial [Acinetobacter baumannii]
MAPPAGSPRAPSPAAPAAAPDRRSTVSLNIARSVAFSGLSATSVQISVTSSNISNADTTGYTRKTASQSSSV